MSLGASYYVCVQAVDAASNTSSWVASVGRIVTGEAIAPFKFNWISGANSINQTASPGTLGVTQSSNLPGGRHISLSWTDASNNFYAFGGYGTLSSGANARLNDIWKWNGSNWTWIWGSANSGNILGTYGTKGVASASNVIGSRSDGLLKWVNNGNLYVMGGYGYPSSGGEWLLNDLWKWDGSNWTWISGGKVTSQTGNYGTIGVASSSNVPGARFDSATWSNHNGDLYLWGGGGFDSTSNWRILNDFWVWDGSNWTWLGGSKLGDQLGTYGTRE
jgi:N-acetylneuraminic acid mutarotase